jgi:hypothetical protein
VAVPVKQTMLRNPIDPDIFAIEIVYSEESGTQNPGQIFLVMSKLIESIHTLEQDLLGSVASVEISPVLVIENVQKGSLITWLRRRYETRKESSSFDPKKTSQFLNNSDKAVISFGGQEYPTAEGIRDLRSDLLAILEEANPTPNCPIYIEASSKNVLSGIQAMQEATNYLGGTEKANLLFTDGKTELSFPFDFSSGAIEDILTKETISNVQVMILKIKKPDYLGSSKWEFVTDRIMEAKVSDEEWLAQFRRNDFLLQVGDAIRARVSITTKYGLDNEVISTRSEVTEVIEIVRVSTQRKGSQMTVGDS